MQRTVILLDGPIGVGKTSLGQAAACALEFGFVDGDDHSTPGHWVRSILRTSRKIVAECENALRTRPAVIVSYPLRCTNWVFYSQTFERMGIGCHCIGLMAEVSAISARERKLDAGELARSTEMLAQGYGQRPFSSAYLRTDQMSFDETCQRLEAKIRQVLSGS
ncbi:hypothetical protein [uncultured Jannaschia sp.]|uniref:hypothetical protein n=1 Tax=uncultured Jannaschia sp. TaxID=293347 RepID=UPI002616EE45|nr:hypothetical protein [uncultured Jannaschia sp.]